MNQHYIHTIVKTDFSNQNSLSSDFSKIIYTLTVKSTLKYTLMPLCSSAPKLHFLTRKPIKPIFSFSVFHHKLFLWNNIIYKSINFQNFPLQRHICSVNKNVGQNLSIMATELVEKDCVWATACNFQALFCCWAWCFFPGSGSDQDAVCTLRYLLLLLREIHYFWSYLCVFQFAEDLYLEFQNCPLDTASILQFINYCC